MWESRKQEKEVSESFRWSFSNLNGIQITPVLVKMRVTDSVGLGGAGSGAFPTGDADAAGLGSLL